MSKWGWMNANWVRQNIAKHLVIHFPSLWKHQTPLLVYPITSLQGWFAEAGTKGTYSGPWNTLVCGTICWMLSRHHDSKSVCFAWNIHELCDYVCYYILYSFKFQVIFGSAGNPQTTETLVTTVVSTLGIPTEPPGAALCHSGFTTDWHPSTSLETLWSSSRQSFHRHGPWYDSVGSKACFGFEIPNPSPSNMFSRVGCFLLPGREVKTPREQKTSFREQITPSPMFHKLSVHAKLTMYSRPLPNHLYSFTRSPWLTWTMETRKITPHPPKQKRQKQVSPEIPFWIPL